MNYQMPLTTTATELQRNYKQVISRLKKTKEPIIIMSNNAPSGVIIDYKIFLEREEKLNMHLKHSSIGLKKYEGLWSKKEADQFNQNVNEMFETVDDEAWKKP
ncbi:MAG: type II toxin-antitoxin system Phd/YefM family antitoxin [bacterium]|nr:type II toxin-antitoxin system Phd/YefM family antitoxin [bacterium]